MTVTCDECDPPRELANAGALTIHRRAKHGTAAGVCDECDPPREWKNLKAHQRGHKSTSTPAGENQRGPVDPAGVEANPAGDDDTGERAPSTAGYLGADDYTPPPTPRRGRLSEKLRAKMRRGGTNGADAGATITDLYTTPGERSPGAPRARTTRRATTAPIMSLLWGGVGRGMERTGADIPVGRVLQFQAPAAGDILDRLIAKTWVDRVLQPFAQKTDDLESLGALFALPALVGMVERSPAMAVSLEPLLREAIAANILSMAPVVKKRKADAKKLRDVIVDLDPDLAASGADPVDVILASIFAEPTAPMPQEGNRADGNAPAGAVVD